VDMPTARVLADAMTRAGVKPWRQVATFTHLGYHIGHGGKAFDPVQSNEARKFPNTSCGYCGAEEGGGAGGGCPGVMHRNPTDGSGLRR